MTEPVHIAIDARPLSRSSGGIKRYLECLLKHMIRTNGFRFTLFSDGQLPGEYIENRENVFSRIVPFNTTANKLLWQFYIYTWLKNDKPDVFWSPRHHIPWLIPTDIPVIVTIHDVIWKTHPQTLERTRLLNEKLSMPHAIQRANKILSPSKATADEIIKYWPTTKNKISITQHGATEFSNQADNTAMFRQNYFLAVGTIEPRKNYIRLVKAFDQWANKNQKIDLVIAGQKGWGWKTFSQQLNLCKHQHRIHVVTDADDSKLANLYNNASAFIQVSLAEGFGMPITEARQFGLPWLLSDIAVFREITDKSPQAAWCDPNNESSIVNGLSAVLKFQNKESQILLPDWQQISRITLQEFYNLSK